MKKTIILYLCSVLITTNLIPTSKSPSRFLMAFVTKASEEDFLKKFSQFPQQTTEHLAGVMLNNETTPILQYIIQRKWFHATHFLLQHQAPLNAQNDKGKTALHVALEVKAYNIVILLLQHRININIKTHNQITALDIVLHELATNSENQNSLFCILAMLVERHPKYTHQQIELAQKIIIEKHWSCYNKNCTCQWNRVLEKLLSNACFQLQKQTPWTFNGKSYNTTAYNTESNPTIKLPKHLTTMFEKYL